MSWIRAVSYTHLQEAVQHKMKRQIELAGVKKIRVHDIRHSHVAYLIRCV